VVRRTKIVMGNCKLRNKAYLLPLVAVLPRVEAVAPESGAIPSFLAPRGLGAVNWDASTGRAAPQLRVLDQRNTGDGDCSADEDQSGQPLAKEQRSEDNPKQCCQVRS
jgi:hypothetical protein